MGQVCFLAGGCKECAKPGRSFFVLAGAGFSVCCGTLNPPHLVPRLTHSEMACYMPSGTLNPPHLVPRLTHSEVACYMPSGTLNPPHLVPRLTHSEMVLLHAEWDVKPSSLSPSSHSL